MLRSLRASSLRLFTVAAINVSCHGAAMAASSGGSVCGLPAQLRAAGLCGLCTMLRCCVSCGLLTTTVFLARPTSSRLHGLSDAARATYAVLRAALTRAACCVLVQCCAACSLRGMLQCCVLRATQLHLSYVLHCFTRCGAACCVMDVG
jgi:hypothetical protein